MLVFGSTKLGGFIPFWVEMNYKHFQLGTAASSRNSLLLFYFHIQSANFSTHPSMNGAEELTEPYSDRLNLKGAFTGSLPTDPPLLYDLGIDLKLIKTESLLPVNVFRSRTAPTLGKGSDLTGPILFLALFTALLVLHGKIHFGYIYFISLFSCASIYTLLVLVGAQACSSIVTCSVLGYSMGPILLFSILNIVLKWIGLPAQLLVGALSALWAAYTAGVVFRDHMALTNKLFIVSYPIFLVYLVFVLMVVF